MNSDMVAQDCLETFTTIEHGANTDLSAETIRKSIGDLEKAMLALPEEQRFAVETMHNFIDGVYIRTVFMKAGSLITGAIHKLDHCVIIGQGSASVISEEFGAKHIKAPMVFISRPVVKRALFIHEDMVWTTVHQNPTNTRDLHELEIFLTLADYEQKGDQ